MIDNEVGELLRELAVDVTEPNAIVEIGSYRGKSTAFLASGARNGVRVFAVDPWETRDVTEWCWYFTEADQPRLEDFYAALESAGLLGRTTALMGRSVDVAAAYQGPPISLLFIDGDHAADAVVADFESWSPHLAPGAIVVFDDYGVTVNPGVKLAIEKLGLVPEIKAHGRLAIVRVP